MTVRSNPTAIRSELQQRRSDIRRAHQEGQAGSATSVALTAATDEAVVASLHSFEDHASIPIAVLALGGYGRVELSPSSDIDIMILVDDNADTGIRTSVSTSILHSLWDAGVDLGHSVRTIDDALALRTQAMDAWASLLECRFVCGNKGLFGRFLEALQHLIQAGQHTWFIEAVLRDVESRHERYGHSVKLLEPNIKKSAGGLRDLQTVFWLMRGTDARYLTEIHPVAPAMQSFLGQFAELSPSHGSFCSSSVAALDFLLRVRHEMHYLRSGLHDTLEHGLQVAVADRIPDRNPTRPVEAFMGQYYEHARNIYRLNQRVLRSFHDTLSRRRASSAVPSSDGKFLLQDKFLSRNTDYPVNTQEDILQSFVLCAEHDLELDSSLLDSISAKRNIFEQPPSEESAGLFRRILNSKNVAETIRAMNDLGVLERLIPEFGGLVTFFQHSMYHYYTSDEHTLIALEKAEHLRDDPGILREVYRNLRRKETLYLAILLHDIAKPLGVTDHEIRGVSMAENVLQRLGYLDVRDDVLFLVRNHLLMEQIAFRRNIHDAETIREFASRFPRPELLNYLFVLTYADLSAVNINVWTEWKAVLLQELYQRTSEVLRLNLSDEQVLQFHAARREAAVEAVMSSLSDSMPRDHVEKHLLAIQNDAYLSIFNDQEIGEHIRKTNLQETVSTIASNSEGYTEITVITRDAPFALARMCAVLSANDANIFDATVFTRTDGVVIDRFRVTDAASHQTLEQRVSEKIEQDLRQVFEGTLDIEHLFLAHRRRWKRRARPFVSPSVRTDVEFEDTSRFTIIDVFAPDSVGFLYRVTETLSRLELDIYFAKIATRGDGIVDAFYVLDRTGSPILDPARRLAIRSEILTVVRSLQEQELGS